MSPYEENKMSRQFYNICFENQMVIIPYLPNMDILQINLKVEENHDLEKIQKRLFYILQHFL